MQGAPARMDKLCQLLEVPVEEFERQMCENAAKASSTHPDIDKCVRSQGWPGPSRSRHALAVYPPR
jgi:hypothetical protein